MDIVKHLKKFLYTFRNEENLKNKETERKLFTPIFTYFKLLFYDLGTGKPQALIVIDLFLFKIWPRIGLVFA